MPEQFVIPQFIDSEAKILGPITVRQFVIILIGGMLIALIYAIAPSTMIFVAGAVPIAIIVLVVGFVKVNGQHFHYFVLNLLQTWRRPSLRIWAKDLSDKRIALLAYGEEKVIPPPKIGHKPPAAMGRLQELSLVVNTGGMYRPDTDDF